MKRRLSRRQEEIAVLMARGLTNKAIAGELGISVKTVESHIHLLYFRLGAVNRAQAVFMIFGGATDQSDEA